jgi:hypothetical protein
MTYSFMVLVSARSIDFFKKAWHYCSRGNSAGRSVFTTLWRYDITVPLDCPLENAEIRAQVLGAPQKRMNAVILVRITCKKIVRQFPFSCDEHAIAVSTVIRRP